MVRHLFSRLPSIPLTADEAYSADSEIPPDHTSLAADDIEEVTSSADPDEKRLRRMTMPDPGGLMVTPVGADLAAQVQSLSGELASVTESEESNAEEGDVNESVGKEGGSAKDDTAPESSSDEYNAGNAGETLEGPTPAQADAEVTPFSVPAIKEVLRVLISLLDPQSPTHTDSMRLLGLNLLTAALETSGAQISRFPSLKAQLQDTGCKYLLQLARSESFAIANYAIRGVCTLFEAMASDLKLQYELLLTFFIERLAPTFPLSQEPWNEGLHAIASAVPSRLTSSADAGRSSPDAPPPPPPPPMPKSSDKAPASGDTRDLMLEALALLMGAYKPSPSLEGGREEDPLLALFLNFDCDVDCEDLCSQMIQFLCRAVFASMPLNAGPGSGPATNAVIQDSTQVFALDMLLSFVERLTARQEDVEERSIGSWPDDFPTIETLKHSRGRKGAILEGARRFNAKPKDGLAYLEAQGFISADANGSKDESIAKFLLECPRLDKKLLGDYISRPANTGVLDAFIGSFDFVDKPVTEGLRELLESFRLPGESQQISRITEVFAKFYFAVAPKHLIKSEDAVYVLAYSVIMLNTDLHNAQNKRKMKVEDYRRNLRGVNDGVDFDPDYLGSLYENIRKREIVMPEEHVGQLGFEYAWKELLRRSRTSGTFKSPTTAQFDRDMFVSNWKPLVACIAYAFSTFRDEHLLERAISGFRQCAILASKWGMDEVFDFMIEGLSASTGLLDPTGPTTLAHSGPITNHATVEVEGAKVTVSPLGVRFGADFKGQLAAVVLFTIANGNGEAIRNGWTPIFEIFKNLFAAGLLPEDLASMYDYASRNKTLRVEGNETPRADGSAADQEPRVPIPLRPKKAPGAPVPDPRSQGGGLFSTLSSYLLSPYSNVSEPAPPEVSEEDVESALCSVDCISSCRVAELYDQLLTLQSRESVVAAIRSLRQLADRLTLGQLAAAAASRQQADGSTSGGSGGGSTGGRSTPVQTAGPQGQSQSAVLQQLPYDPRSVFALEMLTNVTCRAVDFVGETWAELAAHIGSLLQSPKSFHPALLERAIVSLLRLIDVAAERGMKAEVISALDLIKTLPSDVRITLNPSIIAGLQHILCRPRRVPFVESQADWNEVLSLVSDSFTTRSAQSIDLLYDLVSVIAQFHLSSSNFTAVVRLLKDIAQTADPEPVLREIGQREKQGYRLTLTEKKELTEYVEACRAKAPLAIQKLEDTRRCIPDILAATSSSTFAGTWSQCWLTLTAALASQCVNTHRPTRQAALTSLQRVLLSSEYLPQDSPPWGIRQIFLNALFPTLEALLAPNLFPRESDATGPGGLLETRVRACSILCRSLLNFVGPLSQLNPSELQELWLQTLDLMSRFSQAGKKDDQLTEAVSENLKNVLLVLHASQLLLPPPPVQENDSRSPSQAALWAVTVEKLTKFLPDLVALLSRPEPEAGEAKEGAE
jgi:brefeldin A-resistance guanine nucleotide exchange factor 1